jgi:hypothetical protein
MMTNGPIPMTSYISIGNVNKVNLRLHHKSRVGTFWRQIIKLDKLDYCALSGGVGVIPAIKSYWDTLIEMFPTLPLNCPILPKKYEATATMHQMNITAEDYKKMGMRNLMDSLSPTLLPNGFYRVVIRLFNDDDQEGLTVQYVSEVYFRMNDENF